VASAQFSLYYTVACAVVQRDVYLASFTPESIRDPRVLEIASKVAVEVDPNFKPVGMDLAPGTVEIQTKKGETFFAKADYFRGHPERPMTFDECVAKFKKNLAFSVKPLPARNIESIIEMARHLEEVENLAQIIQLMA
jgi:2-methylcitrate dehydratase PrpD